MEDALRDAFAATATDCVSTGTVQNYVGYLSYWLQWTYTHRRERITPAWIERIEAWKDADEAQPEASGAAGSSSSSAHAAAAAAVARGTKRRRRPGAQLHDEIRKHLKKRDAWTDADYPICQRHTLEDYTLYLPTLRKSRHADEPVEWSTINAVTSAFSWYMGRHEMSSPPRWTEALRRYKRGMKRAAAQVLQHGGAKRARKSRGEKPEPAADGDDEGGGDAKAAAAGPAAAVPVAIPVAADKATGKDPLKYLLYKRIQEDIFSDDTIPAMQRIARESQESMQKFLEERAIGLGTVTKHGLEEALQPVMQRLQALQDGFGRGPEVAEPSGNGGEPAAEDDQEQERWRWPHYTWGGRIRACPEGFRIPAGSLKEVFGEWMLGDAQRRWRPLRAFKLIDVGEKGSAKRTRLNELRQLMTIAEAGLTAAGFTITSSHTPEEVSAMWSHVVQHNIIQLQSETEQHRQRRLSQLSWLTLRRDIARLRAHH
eukprot:TRINITY_DN586_c0_g1_i2.p1 TRINITY_DN586_c0_g1~~TRINITY_DN586_c0_g1_i2.p1  ORF type:complete len:485 (+),score=27.25 TRINITY_DN586_c0_g1_i2:18-1472(+)